MADPELEMIRQQRLAQLQAQVIYYNTPKYSFTKFKIQAGGGGTGGNPGGQAQNQKSQEEQLRAQEEAKNSILVQIMDQQSRARRTYSLRNLFNFIKCI